MEPLAPTPTSTQPDAPTIPETDSPTAVPETVTNSVIDPIVSPSFTDASQVPDHNDATRISSGSAGRRKKLWLVATAIFVALLLGGGYVFGMYLPNRPSQIYNTSLANTGKAVDKLVSYATTQTAAHYKAASFDGTWKLKSSSVSADGTLRGAFNSDGNGTLAAKADVSGQNLTVNLRSIKASGNTSSDVYVQVGGVKSLLENYGLGSLDSQWVSIDHTLVDTYASSLQQNSGSLNSLAGSKIPTSEQIDDAISKLQTVNKQYIFSTDSSKAVLTHPKFVARETKNGRSVDQYKVGYDKAHLQSYVAAVKTALDSSKLNDWAKQANNKSISESMDLSGLQNSIENAKADYTFDIRVDVKTKLISSISFTDPKDSSSKFSIGQNYTGGSTYPLVFAVSSKDSQGTLNLTVDTRTNKYVLDLTGTSTTKNSTSFAAHFSITPSNQTVNVSTPPNAQSINTIFSKLGLGSASAGAGNALSGLTPQLQ
jgi:hypothetical protein